MSSDFEYGIVGGGVVGSAAAYLLARNGSSLVLCEQFELGHERGSSHGESRITRYSYDYPIYVRMAKRAYELWQEIMDASGEALFVKTGGLDLDEENGVRIAPCINSLRSEQIPFEILDAKEITRRFPQFQIPPHTQGLYQADTGILNASLCVKTLQRLAAQHGAQLRAQTPIVRIEWEGKHIRLSTASGSFKVKKLILTAGGWAGPLTRGLGLKLPLVVSQEQYAYFKTMKPADFAIGKFPVFIHYGGVGSGGIGWYGFPIYGQEGVKSSVHKTGKEVTADTRDFIVYEKQLRQLQELMRELLPDAAGEIISSTTCLYTNTPDTNFVIDKLPGRENAVFFAGCSGHAFKFAAVIAEMLIARLEKREFALRMSELLNAEDAPISFSCKRFNAK